ncbi:hypothetical protein [Roseateles asaccharophilus]|uniref:CheY-like chemotaxis protein n=1 Tax=Roseateles asaccharophilus TaxID=582607 RepID=A0ABU2A6T7_9BURK|nr:hypothetical protein [Roseateles asaccharophilus]MDR7332720.1 CheY-like chemotaxis protein [Roseateles asaccharophilus]
MAISAFLAKTWQRWTQWTGLSRDGSPELIPEAPRFRVLVVSTDPDVAENIGLGLALSDHVQAVTSLDEALSSTRQLVPNVALVDIDDGQLNGIAVAAALRPLCGGGTIFVALSRSREHGLPEDFDFCIAPPAEPERWPRMLASVIRSEGSR